MKKIILSSLFAIFFTISAFANVNNTDCNLKQNISNISLNEGVDLTINDGFEIPGYDCTSTSTTVVHTDEDGFTIIKTTVLIHCVPKKK